MSKTIDVDTKTFVRFWLVILGFVLLGLFVVQAWTGILIVLASLFLALALQPLAKKIDNIDRSTERKSLSSVLAVVLVVVGIVAIIGVVGPMIIDQATKFLSQAPAGISNALDNIDFGGVENFLGVSNMKGEIIKTIKDVSGNVIGNISGVAVSSINTISSALTAIVFVVVLTILFMLQGPELMESFWKSFAKRDEESSKTVRRVTERLAGVISTYVSRQVLVALIDGIVTGLSIVVLSLIFGFNTGLAIPMGLISFIMYLIPMFGPIIAAVLNSVLLFLSSPWAALAFLIFYIVYEQIENNVVAPRIQAKGLSLSPLVVLISITIGMYAFGLLGCIISVPIAGCIKVLIDEYPNLRALSDK